MIWKAKNKMHYYGSEHSTANKTIHRTPLCDQERFPRDEYTGFDCVVDDDTERSRRFCSLIAWIKINVKGSGKTDNNRTAYYQHQYRSKISSRSHTLAYSTSEFDGFEADVQHLQQQGQHWEQHLVQENPKQAKAVHPPQRPRRTAVTIKKATATPGLLRAKYTIESTKKKIPNPNRIIQIIPVIKFRQQNIPPTKVLWSLPPATALPISFPTFSPAAITAILLLTKSAFAAHPEQTPVPEPSLPHTEQ
jgi:hypothetical protein